MSTINKSLYLVSSTALTANPQSVSIGANQYGIVSTLAPSGGLSIAGQSLTVTALGQTFYAPSSSTVTVSGSVVVVTIFGST